MIDYESTITEIVSDMQMGYENGVLKAVQNVGFHVNKEELTKALSYDRGQYQKGYVDGLNADKWIPCSERLPEDRTEVLAWFSNPNMHSVAWYSHEHKVWFSNDFVTEDSKYVLAWQPLPAPYQKGE